MHKVSSSQMATASPACCKHANKHETAFPMSRHCIPGVLHEYDEAFDRFSVMPAMSHAPYNTPCFISLLLARPASPVHHEYMSRVVLSTPSSSYPAHVNAINNG